MKLLVIQLVLLAIIVAAQCYPSWRRRDTGDDDESHWRDRVAKESSRRKKSDFLSGENGGNDWRSQRSLNIEPDNLPFYSYFEKKWKKDKKLPEPKDDTKIASWSEGDDGVISCPPDFPKCIPRLGR